MKANLKKVKSQRQFTTDFKRVVVSEFESGKYSVNQLSKLHGIACQNIYQWIYKFSTFNERGFRVVEMKDSTSKKVKDLERKVKDLERMVGQKQIKIDYLEKMIEIAKEQFDMDIKKNSDTPPSSGLKNAK